MSDKAISNTRIELPAKANEALISAGLPNFKVGDLFIRAANGYHNYSEIYRINKIVIKKGVIQYISYGQQLEWDSIDEKSFSNSYGSSDSIEDFINTIKKEGWVRITPEEIKSYQEQAEAVINGTIPAETYSDKGSDNINTETALMGKATKAGLIALQQDLEKKKSKAEIIARFIGREMEKKRQELDAVRKKMYAVVAEFNKKIEKIMKVITVIELYLGIDEELFCIQEGQKAPSDTPITFRQAVLYMDEEIGHWKDGGLDFSNIEWFDEWLTKDDNYKKLLPEPKGVIVFRPRRNPKKYDGYDPILAARYNLLNVMTYLLIRNGDCLYRVYTEKITIAPTLFPKRGELQKMMEEVERIMRKGEDMWSKDERDMDELENIQYQYRKRAVLMQGLIDRTDILHPLPADKINIFNLDEAGDKVNFVYDAEAALTEGRLPFNEWQQKLNNKIKHGSRILLTGEYKVNYSSRRQFVSDRIFYYTNEYNTPPAPPAGIYDVEEYKEITREWLDEYEYEKLKENIEEVYETRQNIILRHWRHDDPLRKDKNIKDTDDYVKEYLVRYHKKYLTILYNPMDEVQMGSKGWGDYDPHTRKKRIRFKISKKDNFILNYDRLILSDIEFYLTSRVDRPNYLDMMPVLENVKKFMLEEQNKEDEFKKLIFGLVQPKLKHLDEDRINNRIKKCFMWWKYKNKIKRAITKDDALAFRMISKRLLSPNWNELEWD